MYIVSFYEGRVVRFVPLSGHTTGVYTAQQTHGSDPLHQSLHDLINTEDPLTLITMKMTSHHRY